MEPPTETRYKRCTLSRRIWSLVWKYKSARTRAGGESRCDNPPWAGPDLIASGARTCGGELSLLPVFVVGRDCWAVQTPREHHKSTHVAWQTCMQRWAPAAHPAAATAHLPSRSSPVATPWILRLLSRRLSTNSTAWGSWLCLSSAPRPLT